MTDKRVFFETYGCQMNKLDSEMILGDLMRDGYAETTREDDADVILINTCSVREHAEDKVFSRVGELRALKRRNPAVVIGIVGCMAQKEGDTLIKRMPHVDLVCGTHQYPQVARYVRQIQEGGLPIVSIDEADGEDLDWKRNPHARSTPFSAYVLAMKGCDCRCTFCVVPYTRGTELSRPIEDVVAEVRRLTEDGVVEVTLIGQNITSYGKNLSPSAPQFPLVDARPERKPERWEVSLARLLRGVAALPAIRRVRFLTGHPSFVDGELFETLREVPKICPYLHVPAQSGSDRILKRMKRGYTRGEYLDMVARGREAIPDLAFTSDFIVGFPGETDEDFQASIDLMERVRFQGSFVFKYSPRPHTPAFKLPDDVPGTVKKERNQVLLKLQERHSAEHAAAWVGREVEVLFEGPSKTNPHRQAGRTRWNQITVVEDPRSLAGRFARVRVTRATALTLFGELVDQPVAAPSPEPSHAR